MTYRAYGEKGKAMRFDRTNGKAAKYMVSIYEGLIEDHYYYHYKKDAEGFFDKLLRTPRTKGTRMTIYDLQKDKQIAFHMA